MARIKLTGMLCHYFHGIMVLSDIFLRERAMGVCQLAIAVRTTLQLVCDSSRETFDWLWRFKWAELHNVSNAQ